MNDKENLKEGIYVLINKNCWKIGKILKNRKYNLRLEKITGAILNIYYGELISIRIDRTINNFIEWEEVIAKAKILKLGYFDI